MTSRDVFAGLNPEQRRAVETVRGPLCILAGAGSGKTTTITHRIAHQVRSGAFTADSVLAVTFTDKAAGEMRTRLRHLDVENVRARTFHSAALAQLHGLGQQPPGTILPSKAVALRQIANTLPRPYRFRPAGDLANEIEWARNRLISPAQYRARIGEHEPPIPPDLMVRVYERYEKGKRERGLIDFEDVLELAIRLFDTDEDARMRFHARYRTFTVDEYQDVNLLQQTLLERWLGERDDLCVVGDDYQSIYAFTGASPEYLIHMPRRFPRTTIVRLEENYRSTPQILEVANRLAPHLGGAEKTLRTTRADGPAVVFEPCVDGASEAREIVRKIGFLHAEKGVAYEEMAILFRVNFRSEDFEEALSAAAVPYQVRDGAFLGRVAARRILPPLRRRREGDVASRVRTAALREGWLEDVPDGLGEQEVTRQNDLGRLVRLAEEFEGESRTCADFVVDLEARFSGDGDGRGVNLLTLHRAKGLEFEAVFLPRVVEGELPFKRATSGAAVAEERRLLYVGLTRAKEHLIVTWPLDKGKPSRFLGELAVAAVARRVTEDQAETTGPEFAALKSWRLERSKADGVPAYVVFHDATLKEIARRRPVTHADLARVPGVGGTKLERYGDEVLRALSNTG
ncbi:MAG TPA: ATP-dependent DNA helicase UvrD2 [Actinomycetota bacterium]|nr:ATP-dependent DNA helicase UvrD2 [Actinomycetota bacterium]